MIHQRRFCLNSRRGSGRAQPRNSHEGCRSQNDTDLNDRSSKNGEKPLYRSYKGTDEATRCKKAVKRRSWWLTKTNKPIASHFPRHSPRKVKSSRRLIRGQRMSSYEWIRRRRAIVRCQWIWRRGSSRFTAPWLWTLMHIYSDIRFIIYMYLHIYICT